MVVVISLGGILLLLLMYVFSWEAITWEVFGDLDLLLQFDVIVPVEPLSQLLLKFRHFSPTKLSDILSGVHERERSKDWYALSLLIDFSRSISSIIKSFITLYPIFKADILLFHFLYLSSLLHLLFLLYPHGIWHFRMPELLFHITLVARFLALQLFRLRKRVKCLVFNIYYIKCAVSSTICLLFLHILIVLAGGFMLLDFLFHSGLMGKEERRILWILLLLGSEGESMRGEAWMLVKCDGAQEVPRLSAWSCHRLFISGRISYV